MPLIGAGLLAPWQRAVAPASAAGGILLVAELELGGGWGASADADVTAVIERMRTACLGDVALLSEHQPERLRVDDQADGNPSIWLHADFPKTAWVRVVVGTRDWCNLAYQFGHELGHVYCNSWQPDAGPQDPCQWVEEALAEAFSLRGLARLADNWERAPPFPNDGAYGDAIRSYRATILAGYRKDAREQGMAAGFGAWFKAHRTLLEHHAGLDSARGAVATMLGVMEGDEAAVADMGALNRWPGRSGVPLPDYLDLWDKSCLELESPGRLPARVRELLAGP